MKAYNLKNNKVLTSEIQNKYLRISYATSIKKLKVAMKRIKTFCESLG